MVAVFLIPCYWQLCQVPVLYHTLKEISRFLRQCKAETDTKVMVCCCGVKQTYRIGLLGALFVLGSRPVVVCQCFVSLCSVRNFIPHRQTLSGYNCGRKFELTKNKSSKHNHNTLATVFSNPLPFLSYYYYMYDTSSCCAHLVVKHNTEMYP